MEFLLLILFSFFISVYFKKSFLPILEINFINFSEKDFFANYVVDSPQHNTNYTCEKITPQNSETIKIYQAFNKMREETTFYNQGKSMENFQDNFQSKAEFENYFSGYNSMSDKQLRTYFTWRTNVRKGIVEEINSAYVYIYIYELLHEIGTESTMDGFNKLCFLFKNYSQYNKKIKDCLQTYIHDYIIYNGIIDQISQEDKALFLNENSLAIQVEKAIENNDGLNLAILLNNYSNYNIEKSTFFRDYKEDYCNVLLLICKEFNAFYSKNRKSSLLIKMFGKVSPSLWSPYKGAVFNEYKTFIKEDTYINDYEYYIYKNNRWQKYGFVNYKTDKQFITEIIKGVDSYLRTLFDYPRKLNFEPSTQQMCGVMEKITTLYCEKNKKIGYHKKIKKKSKKIVIENLPPIKINIEIDRSKLNKIREEATIIQEKLTIEEIITTETMEEKNEIIKISEPSDMKTFVENLSTIQKEALSIILNNNNIMPQITQLSKTNKTMPEILINSINEISLTFLNDNIIDAGITPFVYEEYIPELKEHLGGQ